MPNGGAADTPPLPHLPNAGTSPTAVFWTVWWLLELRGPHALQPTNKQDQRDLHPIPALCYLLLQLFKAAFLLPV